MQWLCLCPTILASFPLRCLFVLSIFDYLSASSKDNPQLDQNMRPAETTGEKLASFLKSPLYASPSKDPSVPVTRGGSSDFFEHNPSLLYQTGPDDIPYQKFCSDSSVKCDSLAAHCLFCDGVNSKGTLRPNCTYGEDTTYICRVKEGLLCEGSRDFQRTAKCRYCYQTSVEEHQCYSTVPCKVGGHPLNGVRMNCTVNSDVVCLGRRTFFKMGKCNFSSGYRWSTAMFLSITLGGFGVDRFYLGHWKEGLGKFFSFGGLGVWTLLDILLIYLGYVRPEDGSLYIDLM